MPGALMVVDPRSWRLAFATSELAALLGHRPSALRGMPLAALMPPPFAQLHSGYNAGAGAQTPASSCRAGAVVQLQHASGACLPATLAMSAHDVGDVPHHTVRVTPALGGAAAARRAHQSLQLLVRASDGVVTLVVGAGGGGCGGSRQLFGFDPQLLVGRPLADAVPLLAEISAASGTDTSRGGDAAASAGAGAKGVAGGPAVQALVALAMRALDGAADTVRVGVCMPGQAQTQQGATSSLLAVLQRSSRARPALLECRVEEADTYTNCTGAAGGISAPALGGIGSAGCGDVQGPADGGVQLRVTLWHAEAVTGVVEVDEQLTVLRAEESAALLLGRGPAKTVGRSLRRCAGGVEGCLMGGRC